MPKPFAWPPEPHRTIEDETMAVMTDPAEYQMRTPPMWAQDLGALRAVADWVAQKDPSHFGSPAAVAAVTGVDVDRLRESMQRWERVEPPVLEGTGGGEDVLFFDLTERGRRLVGLWPSPEQVLDRLIAALQKAADDEPDEEKRSKIRTTILTLSTIVRDIGVAAVGQVVGGAL